MKLEKKREKYKAKQRATAKAEVKRALSKSEQRRHEILKEAEHKEWLSKRQAEDKANAEHKLEMDKIKEQVMNEGLQRMENK